MATSAEQFPQESERVKFKPGSKEYEELMAMVKAWDEQTGLPKTREQIFTKPPQENLEGHTTVEKTEEDIENSYEAIPKIDARRMHEGVRQLTVDRIQKMLSLNELRPEEMEKMLDAVGTTEEEKADIKRFLEARERVKKAYEGNQETGN